MNKPLIVVLNGINLNMFGQRDPAHYGTAALSDINAGMLELAAELGLGLEFFQSNHEGEFVEKIHSLHRGPAAGALVNAGAWTHYSHGLADALDILKIPIIEVHMSNTMAREDFRRFSVLSRLVRGTITGFGPDSYYLALRAMAGIVAAGQGN